MTRELDNMLELIEQEGGFRDACTIFQQSAVLVLEEGLKNLSETLKIRKVSFSFLFPMVFQVTLCTLYLTFSNSVKPFCYCRDMQRKHSWKFKIFREICYKACDLFFAVIFLNLILIHFLDILIKKRMVQIFIAIFLTRPEVSNELGHQLFGLACHDMGHVVLCCVAPQMSMAGLWLHLARGEPGHDLLQISVFCKKNF